MSAIDFDGGPIKTISLDCNKLEKLRFFENLKKIGYNSTNKLYIIKAFQRRFRQKLVNGIIDKECLFISISFVKKNKH